MYKKRNDARKELGHRFRRIDLKSCALVEGLGAMKEKFDLNSGDLCWLLGYTEDLFSKYKISS